MTSLKADLERAARGRCEYTCRIEEESGYKRPDKCPPCNMWADHLPETRAALLAFFRSREPGEDEVEVVARGTWENRSDGQYEINPANTWDKAAELAKSIFRHQARAALKAQSAYLSEKLSHD